MTVRSPIVIGANGLFQQLQSGDTLNVPTSGANTIAMINNEVGAIVIGTPVYAQAAGAVKKALASAAATSKVEGLIYDVSIAASGSGQMATSGLLTATTAQWDAVAGTTGGLTFNTNYFLSPTTAGQLTATPPATVGQNVVRIGRALSTTTMMLDIQDEILL